MGGVHSCGPHQAISISGGCCVSSTRIVVTIFTNLPLSPSIFINLPVPHTPQLTSNYFLNTQVGDWAWAWWWVTNVQRLPLGIRVFGK